jgi:SAM-dependent methyltransferase
MSFAVAGNVYDRFVGRYSQQLAPRFLEFTGVTAGPVVDVGCGPGALTAVLAERFGPPRVAAVDPSPPFVEACRARVPGADVRLGSAEALPFQTGSFDAALSQLVLSFVADAGRMVAEAVRVVRPGGVVAACTWEANGFELARTFWAAALRFDPAAPDDARLPFRRSEELVALWRRAALRDVTDGIIDVEAAYSGFDDYWGPFASGVGPPGGYLVAQPEERRSRIRDACFELLGEPSGPFTLPARALAIRGRR